MESRSFIYDGISLFTKGYIICDFDSSGYSGKISDSQRDWNSITVNRGAFQPFTSSVYKDVTEMNFSVMKKPCGYFEDDPYISDQECEEFKHWLSRPDAHKLQFEGKSMVYWEGSFNVEQVRFGDHIIGLDLAFHGNRPFASKEFMPITGTLAANGSFTVNDISDDEGFIYPTLKITVKQSGDLTMTNSIDGRTTLVKNCVAGETLTFTDTQQLVTSDHIRHQHILDDFNYNFIRISNTYRENKNKITVNLPCDYWFSYIPVAKVVVYQ